MPLKETRPFRCDLRFRTSLSGTCRSNMPPQGLLNPFGLHRRVRLGKLPAEVVEGRRDIPKLWFLLRRNRDDPFDVVPHVTLSRLGWALGGAWYGWDHIRGTLGGDKSWPRIAFCCIPGPYPLVDVELPSSDYHPPVDGDRTKGALQGDGHLQAGAYAAFVFCCRAKPPFGFWPPYFPGLPSDGPKNGLRRAEEEALLNGHTVTCIAPGAPCWGGFPWRSISRPTFDVRRERTMCAGVQPRSPRMLPPICCPSIRPIGRGSCTSTAAGVRG